MQLVLDAVTSKGQSADGAVSLDQTSDLGVSQQSKRRERRCVACDELEKVPLRHERDEGEFCREPFERQRERLPRRRLELHARYLAVRQLQKLAGEPELVHQLQGRGVNGISAEVAQEVAVLFENDDVNA